MAKTNDKLKQFDAQLKSVLAPRLKEEGFEREKKARLWIRPSAVTDQVRQLVWIQVGGAATSVAGKFTVEFGIYFPKYDQFMNGNKLLGPVIGGCHFDLRARLGMLIAPPSDRWWPYSADETEMAKQIKEIQQLIAKHGLPWFASTDTLANADLYNTGKMPEPDRLRRENFERMRARGANG